MASVEQYLNHAAREGRAEDVEALLRDNPDIDINSGDADGLTALHCASWKGHFEVVKYFLAHPAISVNAQSNLGVTPFLLLCAKGHVGVVRLLLKDPRVDVTLADNNGCTPLWRTSRRGESEVIEWLIASGRDLGNLNQKAIRWEDRKEYTALEIAQYYKETKVASLLERFNTNPAQTRHELRVKLGVLDEVSADLFALTVFLCDDLLQVKPAPSDPNPVAAAALRFLAIATQLPMELQMVLCRRAVGSMKQNILHKDSEIAFKSLAKNILHSRLVS